MNRIFCFLVLLGSLNVMAQKSSLEHLYNLGKYDDVVSSANNEISAGKSSKNLYLYKGLAQKQLYRFSRASKSLKLAYNYDKSDKQILVHYAHSLELEGNIPEAIDFYNKILAIDSTHFSTKLNLAKLYKNQREYLKASDLFTQLISKDSTNGYFYSQLAYCCDKMGYKLPVISYYEKAVELNPNDYQSMRSLVKEVISEKYYDMATYYIDTFLTKYTEDIYLLKQKAYVSALCGRYLDAVNNFKYVTEMGDSSLFTCKYYGQSLYNNGNYEQAVYWLDKYLQKDPNDFQNQLIMGLACQNDYQYDKSLRHLNLAMYLKFDKGMIARIFSEQAKTQIKHGDYRGFRDSTPENAMLLYKQANDNFLKALEINEERWKVYKELGTLYETKLKDMKIALYYYEKYYDELNPKEINEYHLDWIQKKIASLKEEVHFIGD